MNEKIIKPLNNDIKIEENKSFASKMRKNILWLALFFVIMFIIYHSQKSNLSLMWIIFILLQIPYYILKRNKIIKKHKDDFKI